MNNGIGMEDDDAALMKKINEAQEDNVFMR